MKKFIRLFSFIFYLSFIFNNLSAQEKKLSDLQIVGKNVSFELELAINHLKLDHASLDEAEKNKAISLIESINIYLQKIDRRSALMATKMIFYRYFLSISDQKSIQWSSDFINLQKTYLYVDQKSKPLTRFIYSGLFADLNQDNEQGLLARYDKWKTKGNQLEILPEFQSTHLKIKFYTFYLLKLKSESIENINLFFTKAIIAFLDSLNSHFYFYEMHTINQSLPQQIIFHQVTQPAPITGNVTDGVPGTITGASDEKINVKEEAKAIDEKREQLPVDPEQLIDAVWSDKIAPNLPNDEQTQKKE
jgi:hypothetical protein